MIFKIHLRYVIRKVEHARRWRIRTELLHYCLENIESSFAWLIVGRLRVNGTVVNLVILDEVCHNFLLAGRVVVVHA